MLICGHPRKRKIKTPRIKPDDAIMISLTAATGVSFNLDMSTPPPKLPSAPANDHDNAERRDQYTNHDSNAFEEKAMKHNQTAK